MYKQLHKPNSNPVKKESTWFLDIQAVSEKPSLQARLSLLQEIKRSPVWPEYSRKSFLTKELEEAWGFPYPLFGDYVDFKFRGGEGAGIHGKKVSDHVGKTQPYRNPI